MVVRHCPDINGRGIFWIIPIAYALGLIEWVAYSWKRCPRCRNRKWSWGYTKGFELLRESEGRTNSPVHVSAEVGPIGSENSSAAP